MIIKSMSRKTASFSQLLAYMAAEGKVAGLPIVHNLSADGSELDAVNCEFMANASHCPSRKNGVVLYHEILSIAGADKSAVTEDMLSDLAQQYLLLRAPDALAYGAIHFENNPHIHLVISANIRHRAEKLRLSRQAFSGVKRDLEAYQKQRYPQLSHSLVFEKGRGRETKHSKDNIVQTHSEDGRSHRLRRQGRGVLSQKEQIRKQLLSALVASPSLQVFSERIGRDDMALYSRGGRLTGVIVQGKKYRFRTLSLDEAFENAQRRWQKALDRQKDLAGLLAEKNRQLFREYGVADKIDDVITETKERQGDRWVTPPGVVTGKINGFSLSH